MKKLYGIGTGPGDEELLTMKAVRVMEESSVIFAPNNNGKNMALNTAKNHIKDKRVVFIDFPMGKVTIDDYKKAAKVIEEEISEGEIGAFLTIGDPMIYSTFIYLIDELKEDFKNVEIEVIPGIPSFVAAASEIQKPLTVKSDNFLLCDEPTEDMLKNMDSMAILKTSRDKGKILKKLEDNNFKYRYIKRATLEEQEILEDKKDILDDKDYISLILARKR